MPRPMVFLLSGTASRRVESVRAERQEAGAEDLPQVAAQIVDGSVRLDGEDLFTQARDAPVPAERDQFAVRFHLHPSVKANRLSDGHSAMLLMPVRVNR